MNSINNDSEYRKNGILAISSVLKNRKNILIFEKYVYEKTIESLDAENVEDNYINNIFQLIGDILNDGSTNLTKILTAIKNKKIGWDHEIYRETANKINEQDEFIKNPFEVVEGVLECKCGSKKVYSYQKQCRGADEPMTTFAQCVKCNAKWRYSG